jgi:TP901 family phage tail tape measure protein
MASSDIIKIGFDYRSSLAQFEKDTNGVFDGISSKAGKQKITIQLDAKDDKVIDKIKELQKLKLDKFTFEFGNSGLKEQLQTFDKLENKINEIINLSKGIGNSSAPIVDVNKSSKEIDKLENKISELNKKYDELQKKSATGGISGKEVNLVDNDEFKKLSQEVSELKDQFDDLKTHMSLLDDYTVPTDRFFELQTQVEATSVKVSNLVDEMTRLSNVQKNIGVETNISLSSDSTVEQQIKSESELNAEIEKRENIIRELQQLQEKLTVHEDFHSNDRYFADQLPTEEEIREADKRIKQLTGSNNIFNVDKLIQDRNEWLSEVKYSLEEYDDLIKANDQKALDEYTTRGLSRIGGAESFFGYEDNSFSIASKFVEEKEKIQNEINDLYIDLDKLDEKMNLDSNNSSVDNTIQSQEKLRSELKETQKQAEKTAQAVKKSTATASTEQKKDAFPDKDISVSVETATNSIKEENNVLEQNTQKSKENAEAKEKIVNADKKASNVNLSKYNTRLESYNKKTSGYDATIARFEDGGWTSGTYLKNVQAVKNAVKDYKNLLNELKGKDASLVTSEDINKLDSYEKKIKDTIATVTNMSASEKGYNFVSGQKELDKIHKLLAENSKMSSEAKAKIRAYYAEIESGNPSMSLDKIHGEILKIYNAEVEAGRAGKTLWDTLKNSGFHQIAAQMAGMFGVYDVINLGKQAFSTVKELDYALVDLKKTTAMNSSELEQFYYDSNDVAKQMGVTTKEIIDQASSWSRLGYNSKQAATEMAKLSSQFALISPGMDTTTSQEGLVSIMKAWNIGYQDVKSQIMDDINALGNAMAEDNQDIVEGMERSAAALAAVGTSTKDAFALFSGIQEVLQNSEKSGTSLRSVALRLRSFDESTEEYSSDLANITGELADLTKTAEHAQGISVFKPGSTTEFKSLVDYFREIADIWDEMSQKQQNDFLLKAFGRTQAQAGAALIQNFKGVEKALDVMDNAAGSADKEMETAKQSITYKLNELKQTWVGTVQDIANRDDLGKIVDGLTDLSSAIGFVIDKLGLVGTIGLFGGAGTGIFKFIKNFDWVFKPYTKTLQQFLVGQS